MLASVRCLVDIPICASSNFRLRDDVQESGSDVHFGALAIGVYVVGDVLAKADRRGYVY